LYQQQKKSVIAVKETEMPIPILMPALSPTMTEGNLVAWHKQEGDTVNSGDVIAEIETDKATMEVEAVEEGILGKIIVLAGTEGVSVNATIAILLEEGEVVDDIEAIPDNMSPSNNVEKSTQSSEAEIIRKQKTDIVEVQDEALEVQNLSSETTSKGRIFSSPLARRMAEQVGIDLSNVLGSGPNGRIVKADIDNILTNNKSNLAQPVSKSAETNTNTNISSGNDGGSYEAIPNTSMRKIIAQRLTEAKQTAPHFYMTIDCEIDALLETRRQLNDKLENGKISLNDLVIRAAALAMRQVPAANASWTEEETRVYHSVDISVAVAIDGGLITPIIRNADRKGLKVISEEMKNLAGRAREGKLSPEEYQGGTFSISNLGMYGVKEFAAVINPPQGAILAIGVGEKRPVVKDGALAIATVMSCTLSVDHRVVDGAVGAEFLSAFKKLIEDPLRMLL
jgi:pyruvate dehydrogenase E2 component (dihydrolipoamide acetyltransferase)